MAPFALCVTLLTNTPGSMLSSRSPDTLLTLQQFRKKWSYPWRSLWRPQLRIPTPTLCMSTRLPVSCTTDHKLTLLVHSLYYNISISKYPSCFIAIVYFLVNVRHFYKLYLLWINVCTKQSTKTIFHFCLVKIPLTTTSFSSKSFLYRSAGPSSDKQITKIWFDASNKQDKQQYINYQLLCTDYYLFIKY